MIGISLGQIYITVHNEEYHANSATAMVISQSIDPQPLLASLGGKSAEFRYYTGTDPPMECTSTQQIDLEAIVVNIIGASKLFACLRSKVTIQVLSASTR